MKIKADHDKRILIVDFDNTLSLFRGVPQELPGQPLPGVLEYLPKFKQDGWIINIYSRRVNYPGGLEQIVEWMDQNNLPYDSILDNKPEYNLFIDDSSISPNEHSWQDIYNKAKNGEVGLQKQASAPGSKDFDFSSVQVALPKDMADSLKSWSKKNIPDNILYTEDGHGREDYFHVTILYGIHNEDPNEVLELLKEDKKFRIQLGDISLFESEDKPFDVIKVEVKSPDLHKLNKKLTDNVEYTNDFPEYNPHVTLAYIQKGMGDRFKGLKDFEGMEAEIFNIEFSSKKKEKGLTPIKLQASELGDKILPAEDYIDPEHLKKIMDSNKRLWDDAVEGMALKAMEYLQRWNPKLWDENKMAESVALAYGTGDIRDVYNTPVMKAVLDQIMGWAKKHKIQSAGEVPDAIFIGLQPFSDQAPIPLFNITKPGHPKINSTVSVDTLRQEGLEVPEIPESFLYLKPEEISRANEERRKELQNTKYLHSAFTPSLVTPPNSHSEENSEGDHVQPDLPEWKDVEDNWHFPYKDRGINWNEVLPEILTRKADYKEGDEFNLSLDKFLLSKESLELSRKDNKTGKPSLSEGPLKVWYLPEYDRFLLIDGWHRFADQLDKGKKDFNVVLEGQGYTDYWETPTPEDELIIEKEAGPKELALALGLTVAPMMPGQAAPTHHVKKHHVSVGWHNYEHIVQEAASKYDIPYDMFYRLLKTENDDGNPHAVNPHSGAVGLAQFMPETAEELGIDPKNPKQAIHGSARMLKWLHKQFGNWEDAVKAYNWGPTNVQKHLKDKKIPEETRKYVEKIRPEEEDAKEITQEDVDKSSGKQPNTTWRIEEPFSPLSTQWELHTDDGLASQQYAGQYKKIKDSPYWDNLELILNFLGDEDKKDNTLFQTTSFDSNHLLLKKVAASWSEEVQQKLTNIYKRLQQTSEAADSAHHIVFNLSDYIIDFGNDEQKIKTAIQKAISELQALGSFTQGVVQELNQLLVPRLESSGLKKIASTYNDKEMDQITEKNREDSGDWFKDDQGGGFSVHDWNSNTNDFPKPKDMDRDFDTLETIVPPERRFDMWVTPPTAHPPDFLSMPPDGGDEAMNEDESDYTANLISYMELRAVKEKYLRPYGTESMDMANKLFDKLPSAGRSEILNAYKKVDPNSFGPLDDLIWSTKHHAAIQGLKSPNNVNDTWWEGVGIQVVRKLEDIQKESPYHKPKVKIEEPEQISDFNLSQLPVMTTRERNIAIDKLLDQLHIETDPKTKELLITKIKELKSKLRDLLFKIAVDPIDLISVKVVDSSPDNNTIKGVANLLGRNFNWSASKMPSTGSSLNLYKINMDSIEQAINKANIISDAKRKQIERVKNAIIDQIHQIDNDTLVFRNVPLDDDLNEIFNLIPSQNWHESPSGSYTRIKEDYIKDLLMRKKFYPNYFSSFQSGMTDQFSWSFSNGQLVVMK